MLRVKFIVLVIILTNLIIAYSFDFPNMTTVSAQATDALQIYAQQCDQAIGVTVPSFSCDAGTEVPISNFANDNCDQPNRLNQECDPGSRFQVLFNTQDAAVVAHCRKQNHADGFYGDIAVIQTNKNNGATCFYQALGNLNGEVKAPSAGLSAWSWKSPSETAGIGCVRCHDNGALIRSPYLTAVTGSNRLPGAGDINFNRNQPYYFVGADFASWVAYKVEVAGNLCNNCHRMGTNNIFSSSNGTSLDFGIRATDHSEVHKNPHSTASPIWMTPGQITFNQANADAALAIKMCAERRTENPLPNSLECRITQFTGTNIQIPSACIPTYKGTYFADVTGDGKADAIVVNSDKITVRRSDGTGFQAYESWTNEPYFGSIGTYFADVTGDGKADAIVVNSDKITVRRSDGTGFQAYESWTNEPYFGSIGTYFADVTGDGKADAIVVNNDKITVRHSDGTAFGSYESWTNEPYFGDIAKVFYADPNLASQLGSEFADVTGDRRADAIAINQKIVTIVRPSNGAKFIPDQNWTDVEYFGNPFLGGHAVFFADVTGDGKADAIVVNNDKITVRRSNGTAFQANESWTNEPYFGSIGTYFADVTGDGKADAIVVNNDKITVRHSDGTAFGSYESWTNEPYYGAMYQSCLS